MREIRMKEFIVYRRGDSAVVQHLLSVRLPSIETGVNHVGLSCLQTFRPGHDNTPFSSTGP